jgi:hypothetical protein
VLVPARKRGWNFLDVLQAVFFCSGFEVVVTVDPHERPACDFLACADCSAIAFVNVDGGFSR